MFTSSQMSQDSLQQKKNNKKLQAFTHRNMQNKEARENTLMHSLTLFSWSSLGKTSLKLQSENDFNPQHKQ